MPTWLETRCADLGCPQHQDCVLYLAVPGPEHSAAPVLPSLFPFDVPIGDPCPWFKPREAD